MADGDAIIRAEGSRGLSYPLGDPPEPGQAVTVVPGVLWLRLPLPMSLNHINVYALEDGDGWTVVDTGVNLPESRAAWDLALAGPMGGRPVRRVVCTHMHPDHIGLAGWLCRRFQAPLVMTRLEYVTGRMLLADTGRSAPEDAVPFLRAAGWDADRIETWRREFGQFGRIVAPLPSGFRRMSEGDVIRIGTVDTGLGDWRVVIGQGHSPEHACLWNEEAGLLLGGDQILPRISSNVSVFPTEPDADPLGDWLASLERMKALLPDDLLVLPSHGEPFVGVQPRLDALIRGHHTALKRLERTLRQPSRAIDVFPALFARAVGEGVVGMATGEALAHLNYLEQRGRASRTRDADGVDWWIATAHPHGIIDGEKA